jgi:hypothetical protein
MHPAEMSAWGVGGLSLTVIVVLTVKLLQVETTRGARASSTAAMVRTAPIAAATVPPPVPTPSTSASSASGAATATVPVSSAMPVPEARP